MTGIAGDTARGGAPDRAERTQADALAPVRAQLLGAARSEAERIVGAARAEAAALVRQARRDADEAVDRARAQGRADSALAAAAERRRGRERARSVVLGAQREALAELRARVLAAASNLPDEPGYDRLLARLTTMTRQQAGSGATITVQPAGGVVARSRGVLVDCTLPRLADLTVDALADGVRELWTP